MGPYLIQATLSPDPQDDAGDFKADVFFSYAPGGAASQTDPGWDPEVDILAVTPIGIVPPIDTKTLWKLAEDWLTTGGGYDACCRRALAKRAEGDWE